jgi:hypothetical protein
METTPALPVVKDFATEAGSRSSVVIGTIPSPGRSFLGAAALNTLAVATEAAAAMKAMMKRVVATILLWAIVI